MEESPQVEVDREAPETVGTANVQQAAVDATHEEDPTEAAAKARALLGAEPIEERTTIPVELRGIDLLIEMSVPVSVAERFNELQTLLKRLREKFGDDTLLEELAQLIKGRVEKVTVSRAGQPIGQQVNSAPQQQPAQYQHQQAPQAVAIPQTQSQLGDYVIQGQPGCGVPWVGLSIKQFDATSIYTVLSDPAKRNLLTQQDVTMLDAFYRDWYAKQTTAQPQQSTAPAQTSFVNDGVPF